MSRSTLLTRNLRSKAIKRLHAAGVKIDSGSPIDVIAGAVARVTNAYLPQSSVDQALMVRSFAQGSNQPWLCRGLEVREFKPLVLPKPMLEAIERAHSYYALPSLAP